MQFSEGELLGFWFVRLRYYGVHGIEQHLFVLLVTPLGSVTSQVVFSGVILHPLLNQLWRWGDGVLLCHKKRPPKEPSNLSPNYGVYSAHLSIQPDARALAGVGVQRVVLTPHQIPQRVNHVIVAGLLVRVALLRVALQL